MELNQKKLVKKYYIFRLTQPEKADTEYAGIINQIMSSQRPIGQVPAVGYKDGFDSEDDAVNMIKQLTAGYNYVVLPVYSMED